MNLSTVINKASKYRKIKQNTIDYREAWQTGLKDTIIKTLTNISEEADLKAKVDVNDDVINLEAIIFNLGRKNSGIKERLNLEESRALVRNEGMLVYQQLFNGKIMVMIVYPYLEGYGEAQPPKNMEILRPEELTIDFMIRHVEELLKELTNWEDYDDDQPSPPPIGFTSKFNLQTEIDED